MDKIYIYLVDLPCKVHEIVTPCFDGYTVYLNAKLSEVGRQEALDHALWHINNNDFEKENIQEVESAANRRDR